MRKDRKRRAVYVVTGIVPWGLDLAHRALLEVSYTKKGALEIVREWKRNKFKELRIEKYVPESMLTNVWTPGVPK